MVALKLSFKRCSQTFSCSGTIQILGQWLSGSRTRPIAGRSSCSMSQTSNLALDCLLEEYLWILIHRLEKLDSVLVHYCGNDAKDNTFSTTCA